MNREIEEKILAVLKKYRHATRPRELLRKAGAENPDEFYSTLEDMRQRKLISISGKNLVRLAKPHKKVPKRVEAVILSMSRGFAFARPIDGGEDVFIRGDDLKDAMAGDRVVLTNIRLDPKGPKAEVETVREKRKREITGTVVKQDGVCEIIPNGGITYRIPIDRRDTEAVEDGDKVLVALDRARGAEGFRASVVKVYGKAGSARVCADAILDQNGIPTEFPIEVLELAKQVSAAGITEVDLKGRLDLRGTSICTIDGADAKDLDDAISVSRTKTGYKLGVHIADVSHYVLENSAIDKEARLRGTSVYFADRVIPMLPQELSNGACSLNAGEDKLTLSAVMELSQEGEILSYQFRKSVINSKVRGVYSEVNQLFDKTANPELKKKYSPVVRSLNAARELAQVLKERSRRAGTMELESSESKFTLDERGICVDVQPRESGEAEGMIEQLMIAANQAAAMLAREKQIPFVYRVHGNPDPDRVANLVGLIDALGFNTRNLVKSNPATADFAEILEQCKNTPAQKVISHQILRTMDKAKYSPDPIGHFGLALKDYCHFTSPIRRYPDTVVHRILTDLTRKKDREFLNRHYGAFVGEASAESSRCEVRAVGAERNAEDCYMAEYMTAHIGECHDGIISGVTMRGVFVQLPNSVEGFVSVDSFPGSRFRFDGIVTQADEVTGQKLTIGMPLRIRVVAADVASSKIDFEPVLE